jgi:hypothetical protein
MVNESSSDKVTNKLPTTDGSVGKQMRWIVFTAGGDTTSVVETGLSKLTENEALVNIPFGAERWLIVRLNDNAAQ